MKSDLCPECGGEMGLYYIDAETMFWFDSEGKEIPKTRTKIVRDCQNPKCFYQEKIGGK